MNSSITKLGLTVLISLMAMQSFAGGGQFDGAENIAGTYNISGPTNEPGDENTITFTREGEVYLTQNSGGRELNCTGKFQIKEGILYAVGSCLPNSPHYPNFNLFIDLSEVSNLGYFRTTVLCKTIYPKETQMEFLLK